MHEQPYWASSWNYDQIKDLLHTLGIHRIESHMVPSACVMLITMEGGFVKKPTGFMTNAIKLAERLQWDCSGDHRHVLLLGGGRARRAQAYPDELCKQITIGLRDQMIYDQRLGEGMIGAVDKVDDFRINHALYTDAEFYDDISGRPLPKELVIKAREDEIKQVRSHGVYDKATMYSQ